MTDGFQMGRAFTGLLTRPLPIGYGLLNETRLRVVMRQQFGPHLSGLGKLCLKHLGNTLVVLLPRAF